MASPIFVSKSNSGVGAAVSSRTWSHTVATGSNRCLVVCVGSRDAATSVSTVTFNGVSLTKLRSDEHSVSPLARSEIWYLTAPDQTTANVVVTMSATADHLVAVATDWTGVNQTTPFILNGGNTGTSTASRTVYLRTFTVDQPVLIQSVYTKGAPSGVAEGSGETLIYELQPNAGDDTYLTSYRSPISYMSFTDGEGADFAQSVGALNPSTPNDFYIENQTTDSERTSVSSVTLSHTVGASGSNRLLVVTTKTRDNSTASDIPVTGVTYSGVAMTKVREDLGGATNRQATSVWYLIAPATGANNVIVSFTGTVDRTVVSAYSFYGAKQSAQPDAQGGGTGTASSVTSNITTVANNAIIVSALYTKDVTVPYPSANQIQRSSVLTNTNDDNTADSTINKDTAGATSSGWTWSASEEYSHSVVSFAPFVATATVKTLAAMGVG